MDAPPATAWLVNSSYDQGQIVLTLVRTDDSEPFHWSCPFRPYYLVEKEKPINPVKKQDLFTQGERILDKVTHSHSRPKSIKGWEADIDPALSYVYDKGLHFGIIHDFQEGMWTPRAGLTDAQESRFDTLFADINQKNPLKYGILRTFYANAEQPIPRIDIGKLGISTNHSEEEFHKAITLSRISNLPLTRTYRSYNVSEWIRGFLHTYYRTHNILIPTSDQLKLGSTKKYVTGALTITPESGTYFNMVVLDFESLYPGVIDQFNLSYETISCPHEECKANLVPTLDYHVCKQRRGIYSALIGALRDLRVRHYKTFVRNLPAEKTEAKVAKAASSILKLLLVSSYGVTVRIHGLASPLLGEAITAYGRHVLQSTWDMAREKGLKPKYGDTDSVFLDSPSAQDLDDFTKEVRDKFGLELAYERQYAVCVLSAAKKAYFGILPSGEPEIKGLTVAKSNSPRFFLKTFERCLAKLSEGRNSPTDFEQAKRQIREIVEDAVRSLKQNKVPLSDLEYKVELRENPYEEFKAKTTPQSYQAARLLADKGSQPKRGDTVSFVKVRPFKYRGKTFTVKPTSQTRVEESNVDDYVRNLLSSLSQTFEAMEIKFETSEETKLSQFG